MVSLDLDPVGEAPLEIRRDAAVESGRIPLDRNRNLNLSAHGLERLIEGLWRLDARLPARIGKVVAEDLVIEGRQLGGVVVAEPPEPVRGFGHQERWWVGGAVLFEGASNLGQESPGRRFLRVPDPRGEYPVDPGARVEGVQDSGLRCSSQRRESLRLEFVAGLRESSHEFAEEAASPVGIVEPGVLAIEGEDDGGVARKCSTEADELVNQRPGGASLVIPVAVAKADGVGQGAIPEKKNRALLGKGPRSVKFRPRRIGVAKRDPEAFFKNALIGDQPLDAGVGVDGQRLGGNRTLGRPASVDWETGGTHQGQPLFELPDGIFGIPEGRHLRGRVGRPAVDDDVGVDQQGHDRVGVRAGRDLDAGESGKLLPEFDEFTRLSPKPGNHGVVVRRRKPASP